MGTVAHPPEHSGRMVGPYRRRNLLGKGGMGEVYAGFDARLDRVVALKRVWSRDGADDRGRKRLQREARALARLHHPAIVQVFDWVETDDGDWIVMELVAGRSLRAHLRSGPLAPLRAIHLARGVLTGLAVAHQAGLVHRDLKAENVMVAEVRSPSESEQAKILDFGLAKRFDATRDESQLSVGGGVVGTLTAMSPEQCQGREVGPRSDLFSLGSMLYEATTGICPFRADSPAETIQRICTWLPPAPDEIEEQIPAAFSDLITRLMVKDPRRRPRNASEVVSEIDASFGGLAEPNWPRALPAISRGSVNAHDAPVSADSTLEAGSPGGRWGEAAVSATREPSSFGRPAPWEAEGTAADAVSAGTPRAPAALPGTRLRRRAAVALVAVALVAVPLVVFLVMVASSLLRTPLPERVIVVPSTATAGEHAEAQALALAAHAAEAAVVRGLLGFRDLTVLTPNMGGASGDGAEREPIAFARTVLADELLTSHLACSAQQCRLELRRQRVADGHVLWASDFSIEIERPLDLSRATVEHLRNAYPDADIRQGIPDLAVRAEDYEAFLRLRSSFDQRTDGLTTDRLVAALARLESSSPRFLELPLFSASVLIRRFAETREARALELARAAVARAQAIAPDDPRTLVQQIGVLRAAGELDAAERVLGRLRRLEPGNNQRLHLHAQLLERKGEVEAAIALLRKAVARRPSPASLFNLGNMLYRHGDIDGAREALEASLERAPRYYNGLSLLAQLELVNGDPKRAADHYDALVERAPEVAELSNAGTAYLLIGRYADAAARFRRALELTPDAPAALLNLADAELLVGRAAEAEAHYRQLLAAIDRDPEPEKYLTVAAQAKARLGDTSGALEAVHEALQRTPDNRLTAYEASLVFTVLGDHASGLWHARRARSLGLEARWFDFPWFDVLQADLQEVDREG